MKFGIILYNIELDGNLTGVYTNDFENGIILTEIAKFKSKTIDTTTYNVVYFNKDNSSSNATLEMKLTNGTYTCEWIEDNKVKFTGKGFKMNDRQIAIYYEMK